MGYPQLHRSLGWMPFTTYPTNLWPQERQAVAQCSGTTGTLDDSSEPWVWMGMGYVIYIYMYVCIHAYLWYVIYIYICMYVYVFFIYIHTYDHVYIYIYTSVYRGYVRNKTEYQTKAWDWTTKMGEFINQRLTEEQLQSSDGLQAVPGWFIFGQEVAVQRGMTT